MDKKLTDNEVIKALEYCSKGTFNCSGECPRSYNNSLSISACRFVLLGNALDLLNRKDAEIERLRDLVIEGGREQDRLMAEIERLKEKVKTTTENCTFVMRENEKATNKRFLEAIEVEKSEAIKEFAERLKDRFCQTWNYRGEKIKEDIDNLVKEMTGQNDFKE